MFLPSLFWFGWESFACELWSAFRQGAFLYALMVKRRLWLCLVKAL